MRIFMTGADGQLGRALQAALAGHEVVATDRDTVDVSDYRALAGAIEQARPDAVAHLAALTDVDGCARDPDLALRINALGTRNVALACQAGERPLLYVSTNEVFDGQSRTPYYEWDPPRPINAYGYSKWAGEESVKALSRRFYIVRTAWLFGPGGANFVHRVLAQARAGGRLRVVWDEVANPTYVPDLAAALAALLAGHARGAYGIYHLVNAGACSRYDLARRALDLSGLGDRPIEPIRQADYPRASRPPLYTALHNFAGAAGGLALRPWQEALAEFAQAVAAPSPDG
jgi:dTDP-4-dehydrorhamnose reductase